MPDSEQLTRPDGLLALASREAGVSYEAGDCYGRYELVHCVAEGGMATVWLARLRGEYGFEREVAIKMILPAYAQAPNYRDMFVDEARIAARVQHPNVAQILDLGEHDGKLYMVMEWVDGDSLFNLIHAAEGLGRAVPLAVLLRIIADVCAGLHAAHELRDANGEKLEVVHRDVSPQNILVGRSGCVKVIDFGVLKARGRIVEETMDGIVKGKLHYVAPERALGFGADCRADIWALGAILYRILGGRPVYEGQGNLAVVQQLISQGEVRALPRSVPHELREVVYKALARDPAGRYQSMAELQRAIENLLHGFVSVTTSEDVAAFLASVLGPSSREIGRARESGEETSSVRFIKSAPQPRFALSSAWTPTETKSAPLQPLPVSWTEGGPAKPPIRLLSELQGGEVSAVKVRASGRSRIIRGGLLAVSALIAIAGVASAVLAVSHRSAPSMPSVAPRVLIDAARVAPVRELAPRAEPQQVVTSTTVADVVKLSDLPVETKKDEPAPSSSSRKKLNRGPRTHSQAPRSGASIRGSHSGHDRGQ